MYQQIRQEQAGSVYFTVFDEDNTYSAGLAPKKYVLRLLEEEDVKRSLLGAEVFLLWPDDGLWYPAEIQQVQSG